MRAQSGLWPQFAFWSCTAAQQADESRAAKIGHAKGTVSGPPFPPRVTVFRLVCISLDVYNSCSSLLQPFKAPLCVSFWVVHVRSYVVTCCFF